MSIDLLRDYFDRKPDTDDPAPDGRVRHQRASRHALRRHLHRSAHPCHHAGDLRIPARRRASAARSSWEGHARRLRRRAAHRPRSARRQRRRNHRFRQNDGFTPTPVISHAILTYNRGRSRRLRRRHCHHAFAQSSAQTAASNTIRPTAARPIPTSPAGFRNAPTSFCAPAIATSSACPYSAALKAPTTHERDLVAPYVDDLANVIDMDAIRSARLKIGVDALGGASLGLLGTHRRTLRPRSHGLQRKVSIRGSPS